MSLSHRIGLFALAATWACAEPDAEPRVRARGGATPDARPMFLLAGQSNMEGNVDAELFMALLTELGQGADDDLEARLVAALHHWYFDVDNGYASYGYTDEIAAFEANELIALRDEGLTGPDLLTAHTDVYCSRNEGAVAPLATNCGNPFGPELMLGHALERSGHGPTSLVKVALGGSTLFTDWRSPSSGGTVGPQYVLLQQRIASLVDDPAGVHPTCAGEACRWGAFIWFQGENDSFGAAESAEYEANLANLIADVRAEVGDPTLPVIIVQVGGWAQSLEFGPTVAAAQASVVAADANARLVATDDLSGFYHYDPAAQLVIGRRLASVVDELVGCFDGTGCGTTSGGSESNGATTALDDTAGSSAAGSSGVGTTSSAEPGSSGGAASSEGGASSSGGGPGESSASGCGCDVDARGGAAPLVLLALAVVRRRRPSRRPARR